MPRENSTLSPSKVSVMRNSQPTNPFLNCHQSNRKQNMHLIKNTKVKPPTELVPITEYMDNKSNKSFGKQQANRRASMSSQNSGRSLSSRRQSISADLIKSKPNLGYKKQPLEDISEMDIEQSNSIFNQNSASKENKAPNYQCDMQKSEKRSKISLD